MDTDGKNKGGRPRYEPTEKDRQQVSDLAGGGMTHEAISLVMGVARQTLENNFKVELTTGAAKVRAEVLAAMLESAKKGNVAAAKMYLANEPQFMTPPEEAKPEEALPEVKPVKLGKKEQANEDARTASRGTSWETLLPQHNSVQ